MKKLIIALFALQAISAVLGMEQNVGKGTFITCAQKIQLIPFAGSSHKISCDITYLMEVLTSGTKKVPVQYEKGETKVPIDRASLFTALRHSVPTLPEDIYEITGCTPLTADLLGHSCLPILSSNKDGSLQYHWPQLVTNNSLIKYGFTVLADKKNYYVCESDSHINNTLTESIAKKISFVLSLSCLNDPKKTINLLINDFSTLIQSTLPASSSHIADSQLESLPVEPQTSILPPHVAKSSISQIIDCEEDDCFNFDPKDALFLTDQRQLEGKSGISQSTYWKKFLFVGVPIVLVALFCILWQQKLLKVS